MPVQLEPTRMHETLGGKSEARNVYFNFPIIAIILNYLARRTINHRSKFQWLTCITSTGQETRPILSMFCKFHIKKLSGHFNKIQEEIVQQEVFIVNISFISGGRG